MEHTLNDFFQMPGTICTPRILVYPNRMTAVQLVNYLEDRGSVVIRLSDCFPQEIMYLPMPYRVMPMVDEKILASGRRVLLLGLDTYLELLDASAVNSFMTGLHKRLDEGTLNVDYLLSTCNKPPLLPRYEESLRMICFRGNIEKQESFTVTAFSDKWAKEGDCIGYKELLTQVDPFFPSGNYTLILKNMCDCQAGIGTAVTFVTDIHNIALRQFGMDIDIGDAALNELLLASAKNGTTPESFLSEQFGENNCNIRLALKRLLELPQNAIWQAYVWFALKRLPPDSYIARVLSEGVTFENLLWKYAVGTAVSVLTERKAKQFALERAEALKELNSIEPLVVEFIGHTRDRSDALPFLNCHTLSEREEIIRRVSKEELHTGLPRQYRELYPLLADYFSFSYEYPDHATTDYFKEYRRLRIRNTVTEDFVSWASRANIPALCPSRDTVLNSLREQPDTALLIVDGMGAEFIPLLLAMAKLRGMNVESCVVATANIPTATKFNPIYWSEDQTIPSVKGPDNIVHDGAEKHEKSSPERSFVTTLQVFETEVMTRIADGLTRFSRVVVTADHGSSRLALIARQEGKGVTVPWDKEKNGEPLDWRFTLAPKDGKRPSEFESQYFPNTGETYWVVRGYNRLPKQGGKTYGLHGGATLEEVLVPVLIFTKNTVTIIPEKSQTMPADNLGDNLEGLI